MARAMGHFRADSIKIAQRRAAIKAAPTYNYWIHWRAKIFEGRAMSHHEIEMPLVFMNSDATPTFTGATAEVAIETDVWAVFTPALKREINGCSPADSALVTSHGAAMLENSAQRPTPIHQKAFDLLGIAM